MIAEPGPTWTSGTDEISGECLIVRSSESPRDRLAARELKVRENHFEMIRASVRDQMPVYRRGRAQRRARTRYFGVRSFYQ